MEIFKQDRRLIAQVISDLTRDQFLMIPEGRQNNILWNLGHIIVTQQALHYKLSGLDLCVSHEIVAQFKSGTSPADWDSKPDIALLKSLLVELPLKLEQDYKSGRFSQFTEYTTATGINLPDFAAALSFNNFHEGVHLGIIMSIKKVLSNSEK